MKNLLFFILVFFISGPLWSVHYRGGEITWECISTGSDAGKLKFNAKLYWLCSSDFPPASISITNPLYSTYGGSASISCIRTSTVSVNAPCDTGSAKIICDLNNAFHLSQFSMWVLTFESQPIQINGIPSASGSEFTYTTCCRPTGLKNYSGSGVFLRSVMYPYYDPITGQALSIGSSSGGPTCYDSSPKFAEPLSFIGQLKKINHFSIYSTDKDYDSLSYDLSMPRQSASNGVFYYTGYSAQSPLPSTAMNSLNIPLTLNKQNGNAYFRTQVDSGTYGVSYVVSSYRYGQKIAEVYRDNFIITGNPAYDANSLNNTEPTITFKNQNEASFRNTYSDTFNLGDTVKINIKVTDVNVLYGTTFQSPSFKILPSTEMGSPFGTGNCPYNSCAEMDTNTIMWDGQQFKYSITATGNFKWYLDCDLMNPFLNSNRPSGDTVTYTFTVKAKDNLCPLPLTNIKTFSITVIDPKTVSSALKVVETRNGDAKITWSKHVGTGFSKYKVKRSVLASGPFQYIDSTTNINDTIFTDTSSNWNQQTMFYQVISEGSSRCEQEKNRVNTIVLNVNDNQLNHPYLTWNSMSYGGNDRLQGYYKIQSNYGTGWIDIDSASHVRNTNTYSTFDNQTNCNPRIGYRVLAFDKDHDIKYISNVDSAIFIQQVTSVYESICSSDSILIGGSWRKDPGTYLEINQSQFGCDSLVSVNLSIDPFYVVDTTVGMCTGGKKLIYGVYRTKEGAYFKKFKTKAGCDSSVTTHLVIDDVDNTINSNGRKLVAKPNLDEYQWLYCPSLTFVIGANSREFIPTKNGSYAVIVRSGFCKDTSICMDINTVGIDQFSNDLFNIYPNPTKDYLFIDWKGSMDAKMMIYNINGKEMATLNLGQELKKIDVSKYSPGLYEILILDEIGGRQRSSFVVSP